MSKILSTKRAGELMIPLEKYPHIPFWFTLRQAIAVMVKSELDIDGKKSLPRALLVFDEHYHLLGCIRRRDILRGLEPKFLRTMSRPHRKSLFDVEIDPNLVDLSAGKISSAMSEQAEQSVSEVMTQIEATVSVDDHLAKVIYKMINKDLNLLPVTQNDKVVGVIRSVDVFEEIAQILL